MTEPFLNLTNQRPKGVPFDAHTMLYVSGHHEGRIWWWKARTGWYWEALGNNGEESTEELAKEKAKRWVRDGQ